MRTSVLLNRSFSYSITTLKRKDKVRLPAEISSYQKYLNFNNGISSHLGEGVQLMMPYHERGARSRSTTAPKCQTTDLNHSDEEDTSQIFVNSNEKRSNQDVEDPTEKKQRESWTT